MKAQVVLSVLTALGASLCCVTPLLAITAGTSSVASTFNWLEPFRPYFISATIAVLGFAWFQNVNKRKEDDCGCEPKISFMESRKFLSIVTVLSLLLLTFPTYSKFLFSNSVASEIQEQDTNKTVELAVKGMTCTSCEMHIEGEVKKLPGVSFVKASYEKGSAVIKYDDRKVNKEKIIATINGTGYSVDGTNTSAMLAGKENCTASSCQIPTGNLPAERSKSVQILQDITQLKDAFNQQEGKTKFVAILSSTCKWCLQGAESVQKSIIENMAKKNIGVVIVWTNMLQSDGESTAFRAASLFDNKNVLQFFDAENRFGDVAAKALSSKGEQAWDIYMFFDKNTIWDSSLPKPFDYAHQLGPSNTWVDQTKYFCGSKLTERLAYIAQSL